MLGADNVMIKKKFKDVVGDLFLIKAKIQAVKSKAATEVKEVRRRFGVDVGLSRLVSAPEKKEMEKINSCMLSEIEKIKLDFDFQYIKQTISSVIEKAKEAIGVILNFQKSCCCFRCEDERKRVKRVIEREFSKLLEEIKAIQ